MYFSVSVMMLGYTRTNGVVAYNSDSRGFEEITPATARQLISKGMMKGLKWKNNDDKGEFVCDTEGWNQQNIPIKTACGKFRPMLNDVPGVPINSMCTVVRVLDTNYRGRLYEIVTNKCVRIKINEKALRELNDISSVAGVWITDEEIIWIDGVEYEDRRTAESEEVQAVDIPVKAFDELVHTPQFMEDIFGKQADDGFMSVPEAPEEEVQAEENSQEDTPFEVDSDMMPPVFKETAEEVEQSEKTEKQPEQVEEQPEKVEAAKEKKAAPKRKRK